MKAKAFVPPSATDTELRKALCLLIGETLLNACEQEQIPPQALTRLCNPEGRGTLEAITRLLDADQKEPAARPIPPSTGATLIPTAGRGDTIFVPDIDAAALVAFARCKMTYIEWYDRWNFFIGLDKKPISGRGKTFETLIWRPNRNISSEEVRKYFAARGFDGHTAAFIAWAACHNPEGIYVTIPEENACRRDVSGNLRVPVFSSNDRQRVLSKDLLNGGYILGNPDWLPQYCFVGFREL